jgi:hypothetical protein
MRMTARKKQPTTRKTINFFNAGFWIRGVVLSEEPESSRSGGARKSTDDVQTVKQNLLALDSCRLG